MAKHPKASARMSKIALFLLICSATAGSLCAQTGFPYRDPRLPIEQRISDLLSRMTPEEKVAQLISAMDRTAVGSDSKSSLVDQKGNFLPDQAATFLKHGMVAYRVPA